MEGAAAPADAALAGSGGQQLVEVQLPLAHGAVSPAAVKEQSLQQQPTSQQPPLWLATGAAVLPARAAGSPSDSYSPVAAQQQQSAFAVAAHLPPFEPLPLRSSGVAAAAERRPSGAAASACTVPLASPPSATAAQAPAGPHGWSLAATAAAAAAPTCCDVSGAAPAAVVASTACSLPVQIAEGWAMSQLPSPQELHIPEPAAVTPTKICSHCDKAEEKQWRKRGDGRLLCNRCFMWRRNHGGQLPTLEPPGPPARSPIRKPASSIARAAGGGGSGSKAAKARPHSSSPARRKKAPPPLLVVPSMSRPATTGRAGGSSGSSDGRMNRDAALRDVQRLLSRIRSRSAGDTR